MKTKAFKACPCLYTLPICAGILSLECLMDSLMRSKGSLFYLTPMLMSFLSFAGSMEFVTRKPAAAAFNPAHALLLALMGGTPGTCSTDLLCVEK